MFFTQRHHSLCLSVDPFSSSFAVNSATLLLLLPSPPPSLSLSPTQEKDRTNTSPSLPLPPQKISPHKANTHLKKREEEEEEEKNEPPKAIFCVVYPPRPPPLSPPFPSPNFPLPLPMHMVNTSPPPFPISPPPPRTARLPTKTKKTTSLERNSFKKHPQEKNISALAQTSPSPLPTLYDSLIYGKMG